MKVVRLADAFEYPVTGHFDMRALRLHNKETSNTVDYTLGLSHFLPGGGTEYVETGVELIYFILEGEMTVRTKDETIVLKKYDSIHFNVGDGKEIRNETNLPASMLVIAGMPGPGLEPMIPAGHLGRREFCEQRACQAILLGHV